MCRRPSFKVIDMPRVLNWLQSTEAPEGKGSRMSETTQPVFKNAAYTQEYIDIANSLDGDVPGRRAARAYMDASTAIVHHQVVSTSFVPKLYDAASRQVMREVVETTHRILCKVMQHYLDDAEYRKIFDYDPRLAELILVPRGYDALLPFARFDIFLDESTGDVAFCEFNGDGSSGMNENREITHSVEQTATFKEFAKRHQVEGCELFDAGAAAVSPSPETCEALSHDATVKRNRRVRQRAAAGRHAHRRRTLGRTLMAGGGLVLAALCALGAWAAMRCAR